MAFKKGILLWLGLEAAMVLLFMGKSHAESSTGVRWRMRGTITPPLPAIERDSMVASMLKAMPGSTIESLDTTATATTIVWTAVPVTTPQGSTATMGPYTFTAQPIGPV